MNKNLILIGLAVMLGACANNGKPRSFSGASALCPGATGATFSAVSYGPAKLVAIETSEVRVGEPFILVLSPEPAFRDAEVKITETDVGVGWLNNTFTGTIPGTSLDFLVGCVTGTPGDDFKYTIEVTKGGITNILDPRAVIIE